ncbi:hypothetical protein [Rhizobium sp. L245/93]|nr:hypothetical protein [Rhizobium sp. L245/93]MBO9170695.1 hypothetical protein [Rhizobium sp. L245/93]
MSYVIGYTWHLQLIQPVDLRRSLARCAETAAVVFAFLFLFAFVAGLV